MPRVRNDYKFSECLTYDKNKGDRIRIVMVGVTGAGKTSAIINYLDNSFYEKYVPSHFIIDVREKRKNVFDIAFLIEIQDTSGLDNVPAHANRQL